MEGVRAAMMEARASAARHHLLKASPHMPATLSSLRSFLLRALGPRPRAYVLDPEEVAEDLARRGHLDAEALEGALAVLRKTPPQEAPAPTEPLADHPAGAERIAASFRRRRPPRRAGAAGAGPEAPTTAVPCPPAEVALWVLSQAYVEVPSASVDAVVATLRSEGAVVVGSPRDGAPADKAPVSYKGLWSVGSAVLMNWKRSGTWVEGIVIEAHDADSYGVELPAARLQQVERRRVRLPQTAFRVGAQVEGNWKGDGQWWPAEVTAVHRDGSMDLSYLHIEEWHENLDANWLKRPGEADVQLEKATASRTDTRGRRWCRYEVDLAMGGRLLPGMEIVGFSVLHGGEHPGVILEELHRGLFEVQFHSRQAWTEEHVHPECVRRRQELTVGGQVEVLCGAVLGRSPGVWRPGKVSCLRKNGLVDVALVADAATGICGRDLQLSTDGRRRGPPCPENQDAQALHPRPPPLSARQLRRAKSAERAARVVALASRRAQLRQRHVWQDTGSGGGGGLGDAIAWQQLGRPGDPNLDLEADMLALQEETLQARVTADARVWQAAEADIARLATPGGAKGKGRGQGGLFPQRRNHVLPGSRGGVTDMSSAPPKPRLKSPRPATKGTEGSEGAEDALADGAARETDADAERQRQREKRLRGQKRGAARDHKVELARVDSRPL